MIIAAVVEIEIVRRSSMELSCSLCARARHAVADQQGPWEIGDLTGWQVAVCKLEREECDVSGSRWGNE